MTNNVIGTGYFLAKTMGKAINDYKMIQEGDRVLVGVSGGKDSLSLLNLLHARQEWVPIHYDIIAVHVHTDYEYANSVQLDWIKNYFEEKRYSYFIDHIKIAEDTKQKKIYMEDTDFLPRNKRDLRGVGCFWCSWNRRKSLFNLANKFRCNKVALGHHLDDIVQTTLLNMLYNGEISTMSPKVKMFKGELDIIRPFAYAEEKDIIRYSKTQNYPNYTCKCPHGEESERRHMKNILKEIEKVCPNVKNNIFNSMKRIKKDYLV
jgi:tRNA 2-thiocytidine biosynthesis protein TtcA